jgi:hypothetical protein
LRVAERPFPWSGSRERLMNGTPAEFHDALARAFGPALAEDDSGLLLTADDAQLCFALTPAAPQRIGALYLDFVRVAISVRAGDEAAAARLLAKVDRATQRGGG